MNEYKIAYQSMENNLDVLQKKIADLPKGALRRKMIKGREYYYLQYREGKQVKSRYIHAEELKDISRQIEERKELEKRLQEQQVRVAQYAKALGIHRTYRPVKDVDYTEYTLFMSAVAHDHKSMDMDRFIEKYDTSKYRGLQKRYLAGFFDYISGIEQGKARSTNDLVLDPYTYLMYFKYGEKEVLQQELKKAIPAFLCRGLLITNVQEAVSGSYN